MHRKLFTTQQFLATGRTEMELRWGEKKGWWTRLIRSVYGEGAQPPTPFELALAHGLASERPVGGLVAAKMHGLDGIAIPESGIPRRRTAPVSPEPVLIDGIWCTNGLQTMIDLAALVHPLVWEQANESALHKGLFKIDEELSLLPVLSASRTAGAPLMRKMLSLRPPNAPPTESLLETLTVQLARRTPGVPEPTRQHVIRNEHDQFVARVDLTWPDEGAFTELDGEHHKDQPVYDANRQTEVAIVTGWLCGRFSWTEVRWNPASTGRRLVRLLATARRRPRRQD